MVEGKRNLYIYKIVSCKNTTNNKQLKRKEIVPITDFDHNLYK